MKINWTAIILSLLFTTGIWLFVPSPLQKCPDVTYREAKTVKGDTATTIVTVPGDSFTSGKVNPIKNSSVWIPTKESPDSLISVDYLIFESTIEEKFPRDSSVIELEGEKIGWAITPETAIIVRSNTFYFPGDTLAQTSIEVNIEPRPIEFHMFRDTTYQVVEVPAIDKPEILESPAFWAAVGLAVGVIVGGLLFNRKED